MTRTSKMQPITILLDIILMLLPDIVALVIGSCPRKTAQIMQANPSTKLDLDIAKYHEFNVGEVIPGSEFAGQQMTKLVRINTNPNKLVSFPSSGDFTKQ